MAILNTKGQMVDITVTTTLGETFTEADTITLARLIMKRFGHNDVTAAEAWQRLLQNNISLEDFQSLVQGVRVSKDWNPVKDCYEVAKK